MKAFLAKFSNQIGGLMRCGESSRIVTGEFIMMVMDCGSYYVRLERARGAPVEHIIPEDGTTISFFYWGVPRNDGFVLMPNVVEAYRTGDKQFEYKGTNGFMITIDTSSKDSGPAAKAGR